MIDDEVLDDRIAALVAAVAAAAPPGPDLDVSERVQRDVGPRRSVGASAGRRWALVTAAAAVIALGGFVVATVVDDGEGGSVETTETAPTPGDEVAGPVLDPTPAPTTTRPGTASQVELSAVDGGPWLAVPDDADVFAAIEGPSSRTNPDGSTLTAPGVTRVNDIMAVDAEVWAFGQVGAPFQSIPGVWRSTDGRTWERVLDDAFGNFVDDLGEFVSLDAAIVAAAERDGVIVAAGDLLEQTETVMTSASVVWRRDAAGAWQRIEVPITSAESTMLVTVYDVSATSSGFFLAAVDNADGWSGQNNWMLLWHSSDGVTWERLDSDAIIAGDSIRRVATGADVSVAVGSRGGFAGDPAAWWSADGGRTWSDADIAGGDSALRYGEMVDVIATEDGFVAVGHRKSQKDIGVESGPDIPGGVRLVGDADVALWTSVDGRSWTEVPAPSINADDRLDYGLAVAGDDESGVIVAVESFAGRGAGVTTLAGDPTDLELLADTQPFTFDAFAASHLGGELVAAVTGPPPAFDAVPTQGPTGARIILLPARTRSDVANPPIDPLSADALADGTVTFDEYEQAVFRTMACAEAKGVIIADVVLSHGIYLYGFHDPLDTETVNHSAPLHDDCYRRSLAPLELPYFEGAGLIDLPQTAADSDLASCLDQAGLTDGFDPRRGVGSLRDQLEQPSADVPEAVRDGALACLEEHVPR